MRVPVFAPELFRISGPVSSPTFPSFRDFDFLSQQVGLEYKLQDQIPVPIPKAPFVLALEDNRFLLHGAEIECTERGLSSVSTSFFRFIYFSRIQGHVCILVGCLSLSYILCIVLSDRAF